MKIAIMGAQSFVGARLLETCRLGDGPPAIAVTAHPSQLALPARFNVELRVADPFDAESLARSFAGCGAVVQSEIAMGDPARRATIALCRGAGRAGVRRLIYLSHAAVHGENPPAGTDERTPLRPRRVGTPTDLLAATERQFFAECRQLDLTAYALRPAVVYGPRAPLAAAIIGDLVAGRAWLLQRGEGLCNCVYLDNLVAAIRICLKARNGSGQAYLIRDAETITWREFYHALARELDLPARAIRAMERPPEMNEASAVQLATDPAREIAAGQQCRWQMPYGRATIELGYRPVVPFAEGIRRTCAWWRFAQGEFSAAA